MKSILDKDFRYTNAASTDIRKTFAKARREMAKQVLPGPRTVIALTPKDRRKA